MSAVYKMNSSGPNTDPCGTPWLTQNQYDDKNIIPLNDVLDQDQQKLGTLKVEIFHPVEG